MGRIILAFTTLTAFSLILFPRPVSAVVTHQISITASVPPTPQWERMIRNHSRVYLLNILDLPFSTYIVTVSDGTHSLPHQLVHLASSCGNQISTTDKTGTAFFNYPSSCHPTFSYLILDHTVPL